MLQMPCNGHQVFEVALYNKEVRSLVKDNQSHDFFDDQWADTHVHDVIAKDETDARRQIDERFPSADGFVVERVAITKA